MDMNPSDIRSIGQFPRRSFLQTAAAAGVGLGMAGTTLAQVASEPKAENKRKVKVGVVGCGERGGWIAKLFKEHGGYEFHAVADYFPDVAQQYGDILGVDKSRRFSGLSGYQKLIDSGVEAVIVEVIPYFIPEIVQAAVKANCHVYMAKPVAVDVPGTLLIESLGKQSTQNKRCFFIDYQMPTDPINIEVVKRIHEGGLGKIAAITTIGDTGGGPKDPPKSKTIEDRMQHLVWVADTELGGDMIVNYDIHAIDAAIWAIGRRPVRASGYSAVMRPNPHGTFRDVTTVSFAFDDGLLWNHESISRVSHHGTGLVCNFFGPLGSAQITYWGKSFLRGGAKHYSGGQVVSLYDEGAKRNIHSFYRAIVDEQFDNPTLAKAIDSTLTSILGREAAARGKPLTMDELIKENKRLEVDLTGLKV